MNLQKRKIYVAILALCANQAFAQAVIVDKSNVQNAWNEFKLSGKVEDYLRYAEMNTVGGGETASADADRGADNQVPRYQ